MALSGLDIYKLLPKTNCRQCGLATCLAFAMQLAKKAVVLEKCPFISEEAKQFLEASAQPAIKLVTIGSGDTPLAIGNETVMFRHEEKFHRPCGIGVILEDSLTDAELNATLTEIAALRFERVGQTLEINLIAVRQTKDAANFSACVRKVAAATTRGLILMSEDPAGLRSALALVSRRRPLLYKATQNNIDALSALAKEYTVPVVASAGDLESLMALTKELQQRGVADIILDTGSKPLAEKIADLTQIRRQALKKSNRQLGYPALAIVQHNDPYRQIIEAAAMVTKYAGIVLIEGTAAWQALALLTLRQNIYTDPQKPLQIEPRLYPVGQTGPQAPVLVTTNFSLSYYTVLGEVEASKVPAHILSVDTQGMSVLTAWAAEKFTPQSITAAITRCQVAEAVVGKRLVIPGYVAVMSGDLEEELNGWKIIVGPKEAAGIPAFLKNLLMTH